MKALHLNVKKKWFDMILSGEKKEEYREIKEYWRTRLKNWAYEYDCVEFRNGYKKDAPMMRVELKNICIGLAKPEWSDNWKGDLFVIQLGKILKKENVK